MLRLIAPPLLAELPPLVPYQALWEGFSPEIRLATYVFAALSLTAFAVFVTFVMKAPYGYEDERGFHAGESTEQNSPIQKP